MVSILLVSLQLERAIAGDDMFSILKTFERCGDAPDGRDHAFAPPATAPVTAGTPAALLGYLKNKSPLTTFTRNARSKLPVSYGRKLRPGAKAITNGHPTKTTRRKTCATVLNVFRTAQVSGARSAKEGSASYGITPGEPLSVQRGAPIDSKLVERMIAGFYLGSRPPNCNSNYNSTAGSPFRTKEIAQ